MQIYNLIIEVTRRCQFECDHCLRGRRQNKNMNMKHVETLLDQVDYISAITFTGGEPSMNVDCITKTLELCKEKNISVSSFYIATNGYKISEAFAIACLQWYSYCDDKEMCIVNVSNDTFHSSEGNYNTELLDGLSFFSRKHGEEAVYYEPISEGYAQENGIGDRYLSKQDYILTAEDDRIEEGEVYLNCNGYIVSGCDWSYESQNRNKVCKVEDLTQWVNEQEQ